MNARKLPIGPVPSDWDVDTLGKVCLKIGSGSTPRGGSNVYRENGATAFIRSQNIYDHWFETEGLVHIDDAAAEALRGVTVEADDVLINITGDSILRCSVAPSWVLPARVSQHVAIIRPNRRLRPLFLQKYLSLPQMKEFMIGYSAGGTRNAITKGHIESFPVPIPSPEEQDEIVARLGPLDEKVASNHRLAIHSEMILDAISEMDGSGAPQVRLDELAESHRTTIDPSQLGETEVDHYSIPAFDSSRRPEHGPASEIKSGKFLITRPSILVSRLNPRIPRVWLVEPGEGVMALCSTEFAVLTPGAEVTLPMIWLAVRDQSFLAEMARRATGTSGSHQRVRPQDLISIEVPDTRQFAGSLLEEATDLLTLIQNTRSQTMLLEETRTALTPELITGRLRAEPSALVGGKVQ